MAVRVFVGVALVLALLLLWGMLGADRPRDVPLRKPTDGPVATPEEAVGALIEAVGYYRKTRCAVLWGTWDERVSRRMRVADLARHARHRQDLREAIREKHARHEFLTAMTVGDEIFLSEMFFRRQRRVQLAVLAHEAAHLLGWDDAELLAVLRRHPREPSEAVTVELLKGCPALEWLGRDPPARMAGRFFVIRAQPAS